jgi:dGTPase
MSLNTRERLEARERAVLAPYAMASGDSRGREHPEAEHAYRTAFQRDRDRVIHTAAFRRLDYKTQVFVYHEGDHYRNRLTHSLETAQIGRSLARMLGLNEDLVEAIALAHDLGHAPFGHAGERVLDGEMREFGGFEHNRQSLRVVEVIEHRYPGFRGLNLTWETREGLAKHRSDWDEPGVDTAEYGPGRFPSLEAQIANIADEIAYTAHDLDDGISSELLSFRSLQEVPLWEFCYAEAERAAPGEPARLLVAGAVRGIIGLLVADCAEATLAALGELGVRRPDDARTAPRATVCIGPTMTAHFRSLKDFLNRNLYRHYRVRRMEVKAERILGELFSAYVEDQELLPPNFRAHIGVGTPERIICDYLAGMTDRYAIREYQKLFELTEKF